MTPRWTCSEGKRMFLLAYERGHRSRPPGRKKCTITTSARINESAVLASGTKSQTQTSD